MKLLGLLLWAGLGIAQTYPTEPNMVSIGSLNCGIRLYKADQIQAWCYANKLIVQNTITVITNGTAAPIGFMRCPQNLDQNFKCPVAWDEVLWVFSRFSGSINWSVSLNGSVLKQGTIAQLIHVPSRLDDILADLYLVQVKENNL